ncbi:MAG: exopolygalacturonase [Bacteroidaceae bacterium]|nr:exopolygalacturonase [Bacteroidaceae bacterium]MBR3896205.1 exopolygalacturonase [Bacteroidaceae bacterium]
MLLLAAMLTFPVGFAAKKAKKSVDLFPDGTEIPEWFRQNDPVNIENLGKQYVLTDYEIFADGRLHTEEIQALIDKAAANGGGVIVIPRGTFMTGGLQFKQGTHLYLEDGATLMGSDFIGDYPLGKTRIEGETCTYFGALINADGLDGFTISGKGTIDGNGLRYHKQFWLRRKWNPKCTNKDEQRPRLVYVSNCKNVQIEGVKLQNSAFWTTHIYNSENVKLLNLSIYSLSTPNHAKGPSTDAIDLDVVKNVLVKGCYMSVNDDAIAMKGGKGPWADDPTKSEGNGGNENVIIEDCTYGFCHGCLTCGSESIYNHNIILRRIQVDEAARLLWLKMRPDTPQRYEYITVENITGSVGQFIYIQPWTQFYDLKDRKDPPMSYSDHITMRNCQMEVGTFFNVKSQDDQYKLSNFHFENLDIKVTKNAAFNQEYVEGFTVKNVNLQENK